MAVMRLLDAREELHAVLVRRLQLAQILNNEEPRTRAGDRGLVQTRIEQRRFS
jgi:hypothetical protein